MNTPTKRQNNYTGQVKKLVNHVKAIRLYFCNCILLCKLNYNLICRGANVEQA